MSRKIITGGSVRGANVNGHMQDSVSSLWEYALTAYAYPDVAHACLLAQDAHGVDVNLLLCAAWCAACGIRLDEAAVRNLDGHCRSWREQVIIPLRRQRRAWKTGAGRSDDYAAIKELELAAEREQLRRLETLVGADPRAPTALYDNLHAVSKYFGVSAPHWLDALEPALARCVPGAPAG